MNMKDDDRRNFSIEEAALMGIQMVYQVKLIHEQSLLHNDIKPDNVLISTQNGQNDSLENQEIVIIDYGLAERYLDS